MRSTVARPVAAASPPAVSDGTLRLAGVALLLVAAGALVPPVFLLRRRLA